MIPSNKDDNDFIGIILNFSTERAIDQAFSTMLFRVWYLTGTLYAFTSGFVAFWRIINEAISML